jgi:hypothetical protein
MCSILVPGLHHVKKDVQGIGDGSAVGTRLNSQSPADAPRAHHDSRAERASPDATYDKEAPNN